MGRNRDIAEQPRDTRHTARELLELWSCWSEPNTTTQDICRSIGAAAARLAAGRLWLAGSWSRDAVLGCDWSSRQPHSLVSQARGALGGRRCLARAGTLGAGECGVKRKTLNLFSGVQESSNIDISRFRILCLSIKTSIWLPFSRFWF